MIFYSKWLPGFWNLIPIVFLRETWMVSHSRYKIQSENFNGVFFLFLIILYPTTAKYKVNYYN